MSLPGGMPGRRAMIRIYQSAKGGINTFGDSIYLAFWGTRTTSSIGHPESGSWTLDRILPRALPCPHRPLSSGNCPGHCDGSRSDSSDSTTDPFFPPHTAPTHHAILVLHLSPYISRPSHWRWRCPVPPCLVTILFCLPLLIHSNSYTSQHRVLFTISCPAIGGEILLKILFFLGTTLWDFSCDRLNFCIRPATLSPPGPWNLHPIFPSAVNPRFFSA